MPVANLIAEARPRNRLFSSFQIHNSSLHCFSYVNTPYQTAKSVERNWDELHFKEDPTMPWLFLLVAGLCEIAWAIGLKYTEGFSRLLPMIGTVAAMVASIGFLGLALKSLPVGTAYAVWTGIGTIGTTALGIYLFNEPATLLRLACIGLILSGIIGLKITS
jgi:quaternary ammonium compound-resistance protein SugE